MWAKAWSLACKSCMQPNTPCHSWYIAIVLVFNGSLQIGFRHYSKVVWECQRLQSRFCRGMRHNGLWIASGTRIEPLPSWVSWEEHYGIHGVGSPALSRLQPRCPLNMPIASNLRPTCQLRFLPSVEKAVQISEELNCSAWDQKCSAVCVRCSQRPQDKVAQSRAKSCGVVQSRGESRKVVQSWGKSRQVKENFPWNAVHGARVFFFAGFKSSGRPVKERQNEFMPKAHELESLPPAMLT